nr:Transmembrane protein [Ipomoea batatas]GME21655.1 Transmembrane protein [Ipomoea batatas]
MAPKLSTSLVFLLFLIIILSNHLVFIQARKMAAPPRGNSRLRRRFQNHPAVGHAGEETKARSAAAKGSPRRRYMEGAVDSFRPTAPGHSPGIGHSIHD